MKSTLSNKLWLAAMGLIILLGGLFGFGHKFYALVMLALRQEQEAAFAVAPVVNYLLASLGFLCLVGWAAMHGMFHDIEGPKYTMLDIESQLDAESGSEEFARSVLE